MTGGLVLRAMQLRDLEVVERWLATPHVARWYVTTSPEAELEDLQVSLSGGQPTHPLIVEEHGRSIGWCQWYLLSDYPRYAHDVGGRPGDAGIDYAIGEPARLGRGVGSEVIALLVRHIRGVHPEAGVVADPDATNTASRRVLEKNGFALADERPVASEATDTPMAIYRLAPPQGWESG